MKSVVVELFEGRAAGSRKHPVKIVGDRKRVCTKTIAHLNIIIYYKYLRGIIGKHTCERRHYGHVFLTEYSQRMFFLIDFR